MNLWAGLSAFSDSSVIVQEAQANNRNGFCEDLRNTTMSRAVFVIGCPRSGTSVVLDLLSSHECFAWVSNVVNRNPHRPELSVFNRLYDTPVVGKWLFLHKRGSFEKSVILRRRELPYPVEPWNFWDFHLSKFQWRRGGNVVPHRQQETDMSRKEAANIIRIVRDICNYQKKERFLSKYTDFPRIRYLTQAFSDAVFIHVIRDGRAVAHSYRNKIHTGEFGTWQERGWWIRGLPASWRTELLERFYRPLGLVAFLWKFFVQQIWEDSRYVAPDQYLEVRYEDLVRSPQAVLQEALEFCGLEMTSRVEWYIEHVFLADMNYKWKQEVNAEDRTLLKNIITEEKFRKLLYN